MYYYNFGENILYEHKFLLIERKRETQSMRKLEFSLHKQL